MSHRDDQHPDPSDRDDFERRLNAKLEAERERTAPRKPTGWSQGLKYGSEFIGGVLTGAGLGFIADFFFGTTPWGLFIGVMVGFAAGTLNVVRAAQTINRDTEQNGSDGAGEA